jgi:hypothetical protein
VYILPTKSLLLNGSWSFDTQCVWWSSLKSSRPFNPRRPKFTVRFRVMPRSWKPPSRKSPSCASTSISFSPLDPITLPPPLPLAPPTAGRASDRHAPCLTRVGTPRVLGRFRRRRFSPKSRRQDLPACAGGNSKGAVREIWAAGMRLMASCASGCAVATALHAKAGRSNMFVHVEALLSTSPTRYYHPRTIVVFLSLAAVLLLWPVAVFWHGQHGMQKQ